MENLLCGRVGGDWKAVVFLLLISPWAALATDWPQYRGPTTDGVSLERIATNWPAGGPTVVWRNTALTNGFSSFAVSQGRAFTQISRDDGSGLHEYCVAVDAATGVELWATLIDSAAWPLGVVGGQNGSNGINPYNAGDGPRSTPSVKDGRVYTFSGRHLNLVCMDASTGGVIWSINLGSSYGASTPQWNNGASPRLENDLIWVNLGNPDAGQTLCALNIADGSIRWQSQSEGGTYSTPVVTTIQGVQQVLFATLTGIVSLDRNTGNFLWKYSYPASWAQGGNYFMSMSPVVYSNIVFCAAPVGAGSAVVQITFANGTWSANNELWSSSDTFYQMQWTTPVSYQGNIYGIFGDCRYIASSDPARLWCVDIATGVQRWSQPYFGMGGTILVNNYVLALTEDGWLILIKPDPAAYVELARFRAFQFNSANPGKCWNSPSYSNGRIYARSTTGGICVDVSAAVAGPLAQIQVTPTNAAVAQYGQQQFSATGVDAQGISLSPQPAFSWTASGGGTLDANGLFTAYGTPGGPFVVTASSGGISNSTALNITSNGLPFLPAQTTRVIHELTTLTVSNTATAGPFVMQSQMGTNTTSFIYTDRNALLADGWSFVGTHPNGTPRNTEITDPGVGAVVSYDQAPGVLRIPCDQGDLWDVGGSTRNSLFRSLPINWLSAQLRLSFAPAPTAYYQQVHLGLYQDDDNYIEVGSSYNSGMNMTLETSGSPNGLPSVSASGTLFYFQLNRNPVSGAITGLGSMDGVNWTGLGSSSQALANPRLMIWTGGSVPPYASGSPNCDLSGLTLVASNSVPVPRRFSYQLVSPPAGASIDTNGIITWRPALGQGIGTNLITTVVADNGVPPFYVTNSFSVVVLSRPMIAASTAANSVALAWPGDLTGCQLQTTTNLGPGSQWQPVTNAPQSINGRWTVTLQPLNGRRFYRLLLQ